MKHFFICMALGVMALSASAQQLSLDAVFGPELNRIDIPRGIRPMADGSHYCIRKGSSILVYSFATGKSTDMLINLAEIEDVDLTHFDDYSLSHDNTHILVQANSEAIYRYSTISDYYVIDCKTHKCTHISKQGKISLAEFSPNGKYVAFVRDNDMFVFDIDNNTETRITTDGKKNNIINGATDWVYEEEFGLVKGFAWNLESDQLAFYRFDESQVKMVELPIYGEVYHESFGYKYPTAGEDGSNIELWVYNLATNAKQKLPLVGNKDYYLPYIQWSNAYGKLLVEQMNRLQNHLDYVLVDTKTNETTTLFADDNKCWLDVSKFVHFSLDNRFMYFLSERDGWNHITCVDTKTKSVKTITKGEFDVAKVNAVDDKAGLIYYTAGHSTPLNQELCCIGTNGKNDKILVGNGCNTATFSKDCKWFININSSAEHCYKAEIYSTKNYKPVCLLAENSAVEDAARSFGLAPREYITLTVDDTVTLNGYIIKPQQAKEGKKCPVLMFVYGGPGDQEVLNSWWNRNDYWHQVLVQKGYVIACFDNRGTGGRGNDFKKCTYLNLGIQESDDQIAIARQLATWDFVDAGRIGIWGWSFGGFMSSMCLLRGNDVFKAAVAVAPVSDWRYYDNIYTERFMRTPQTNPEGYANTATPAYATRLKGNFLLMYGLADDNVHPQNGIALTTALLDQNKQFDMFTYPNQNHSIGRYRKQLFEKLTRWIENNL